MRHWDAFCDFFALIDLKKIFLLLNSYLSSLATVLPFIGEGVKEFKRRHFRSRSCVLGFVPDSLRRQNYAQSKTKS